MELIIGTIVFPIGWVILLIGSIWLWTKSGSLTSSAKRYLNIALISFYMLGYTSTMYWLGYSWFIGVIPSFVVFVVLFIMLFKTVIGSISSEA